jgi:hypothetical protein
MEQLSQPRRWDTEIRCQCGAGLYYQRIEGRIGVLQHFYFCRRCGRKFAAWETGWMPGLRQLPDEPAGPGLPFRL